VASLQNGRLALAPFCEPQQQVPITFSDQKQQQQKIKKIYKKKNYKIVAS